VSPEAESGLRVFVGHLGTRAQLLAAVERAAADADELLADRRPRIGREYLQARPRAAAHRRRASQRR
jgi:hypothetical protein